MKEAYALAWLVELMSSSELFPFQLFQTPSFTIQNFYFLWFNILYTVNKIKLSFLPLLIIFCISMNGLVHTPKSICSPHWTADHWTHPPYIFYVTVYITLLNVIVILCITAYIYIYFVFILVGNNHSI